MGTLALDIALLKKASSFLNVLDNVTRWEMLLLIHSKGSMTVTELHTHFGLEQSQASMHLSKLRNAGFVLTTRKAKYIYYRLSYESLEKSGGIISGFLNENAANYLQNYEEYILNVIPSFEPGSYEENDKGIEAWLVSFSQKLKDFTLDISVKKKELLKAATIEGKVEVEELKSIMDKSRKEAIRTFMNQYRP